MNNEPNRLATFVQISDLHFGRVDSRTGSAVAPPALSAWRGFSGLLGHHYPALYDLREFFESLRMMRGTFSVVVTGDLSAYGDVSQFQTASQFLDRHMQSSLPGLGLDLQTNPPGPNEWRELAIPGNHDRWAGSPIPIGGSPSLFDAIVRSSYPQQDPVVRLPSGHSVRFIRIDTDADLRKLSWNRVLARGRFNSQLAHLSRVKGLGRREEGEIRVLLMHHSRAWEDRRMLTIVGSSRRALDQFLVNHQISVILCGHTHIPRIERLTVRPPAGRRERTVLECCCGTTSQYDEIPYDWTHFPKTWSLPPNSLLVHELISDGGAVKWVPTVYVRGDSGFVPSTLGCHRPAPFTIET